MRKRKTDTSWWFMAAGICLCTWMFTGCSKQNVLPEEKISAGKYELTEMNYSFDSDDRIDTSRLTFGQEVIRNATDALVTQDYVIEADERIKTSVFRLDDLGMLPDDLQLDTLLVSIPAGFDSPAHFSYYPEKFPLSMEWTEAPDTISHSSTTLHLRIPPRRLFHIVSYMDRYNMRCSFRASIRNTTTGQTFDITGKWQGVLRYANQQVHVEETVLSE